MCFQFDGLNGVNLSRMQYIVTVRLYINKVVVQYILLLFTEFYSRTNCRGNLGRKRIRNDDMKRCRPILKISRTGLHSLFHRY